MHACKSITKILITPEDGPAIITLFGVFYVLFVISALHCDHRSIVAYTSDLLNHSSFRTSSSSRNDLSARDVVQILRPPAQKDSSIAGALPTCCLPSTSGIRHHLPRQSGACGPLGGNDWYTVPL